MKLKELAIEGDHHGNHRSIQLGRFSDGLNIVYGETGAGKSSVARLVGNRLLEGIGGQSVTHDNMLPGRICILNGNEELNLGAGQSVGAIQLSSRLNGELYNSIFNFSFRETQSNLLRLSAVLRNHFSVSTGPGAAGDDSELIGWQRQTASLNQQLESLSYRISSISDQKNDCVGQLESARLSRQAQVAEVESRIGQTSQRINELRAAVPSSQLTAIDLEIAQLRTLVSNAPKQVVYETVQTLVAGHEPLYKRLDEIDDQIRQWRRIQAEIQNQRVRLRDEMLVWNELTLDSQEHPYHDARAILVALESKVDETERNASLWGEADIERVDATQLSEALDQICKRIRDDLHGLCNELSQQYKHIRHKTAASELKQLRRYYTLMGENIDHLLEQRQIIVREIREVDPRGADAVIRADSKFCECAHREGHLAARRRFVGEFTQPVSTPTYHSPDLSAEHARLALLQQQRTQLSGSQGQYELELNSLNSQLVELTRQRDLVSSQFGFAELESKIKSLELELQPLVTQANNLRRRIDELREFVPTQPNPLIQRACEVVQHLSDGDLTQVFLSQPLAGQQSEVQVRDRLGKVLNASSVEAGLQDQVYLSLVLASAEQLQAQGVELPFVIDDAFSRIPPARATRTLQVLDQHGASGKQVIALTQHRYLSDRVSGIHQLELASPSLELTPPAPASPVSAPERGSPLPYIVPPVIPNNALRQQDYWIPEPSKPAVVRAGGTTLPYPLSKYPRNDQPTIDDRSYTVAHPSSYNTIALQANRQAPAPLATPLPVQTFADQLGYVTSISDSTLLRKVGFFDAEQIRTLDSNGIATVGDLIVLGHSRCEILGIHVEQLKRWQDQLVLLTTVPGMQNKDARILVACGVTEPEQLDTLHPQQLFERVERFLGTTEGRRFAANSEPISIEHIGGWYRALDATRSNWQNRRARYTRSRASAVSSRSRQTALQRNQSSQRSRHSLSERSIGSRDARNRRPRQAVDRHGSEQLPRVFNRDRRQHCETDQNESRVSGETSRSQRRSSIRAPRESRVGDSRARTQRSREARGRTERRESRTPRVNTRAPERKIVPRMAPVELAQSNLADTSDQHSNDVETTEPTKKQSSTVKLKFYLDLNDHIEAAPSIGPKSAERFEKIGIYTVADFLKQTAESISTKLDYKRMTAKVIRDWQHQARLICRIPNLRGHDAQLLVACGLTEPEEISTLQPKTLYATIGPFSETKEGMKIIRNGKKPDLEEITDWISWAGHTRSIKAA